MSSTKLIEEQRRTQKVAFVPDHLILLLPCCCKLWWMGLKYQRDLSILWMHLSSSCSKLVSCEASCSIDRRASSWCVCSSSATRSFFNVPLPPSRLHTLCTARPPRQARTFYGVLISANRMNKGERARYLFGGHESRSFMSCSGWSRTPCAKNVTSFHFQ